MYLKVIASNENCIHKEMGTECRLNLGMLSIIQIRIFLPVCFLRSRRLKYSLLSFFLLFSLGNVLCPLHLGKNIT